MRLAVARLWYCSNSFVPRRTQLADLQAAEWDNSPTALAQATPGSELDGVGQFLATRPDWHATLLRAASAPPGGPLTAEAFATWLAEIERRLRMEPFDGIYLSLHGACQAEGEPAADLTIMQTVRAAAPRTPIVASFDMQANLPAETTLLLDGATANRIWPHGGGDGAAIRALRLLEKILSGNSRPIGAFARVAARRPEPELSAALGGAGETVLDASLLWGFPWGDSPHAGACAMVWADRDARLARDVVGGLARRMPDWRPRPHAPHPAAEAALRALSPPRVGGVAVLDQADDPLAGGLADTPEMLRALLRAAPGKAAFGALHDADLVAAAWSAGIGGAISRPLAARTTVDFGPAVEVCTSVIRLIADEDADGGAIAVLGAGDTEIVVCGRRPRIVDPGLLSRAGIDLASLKVLAIKGGETTRALFAPRFPTIIACDCPGPTSGDLSRLPFQFSGVPLLPWSTPQARPRSPAAAGRLPV